jgi:fructokinase
VILVCGEALIDLVPGDGEDAWQAIPGGGPANSAIALRHLGAPVSLLCRLSRDAFGRQIRAHLDRHDIDLSLAVDAEEPTTLAVVALSPEGSAEYSFYLQGTADWQWSRGELPPAPDGLRAIVTGTLAAVLPPGAEALRRWAAGLRDRAVVCYDVNARPSAVPDRASLTAAVSGWLDTAHIVKASDEDLAHLCPGRSPQDTARRWIADHGVDLVLITRGAKGATACAAGLEPVHAPGVPVQVVDTVGAGDTFGATALVRLEELGLLDEPGRLGRLDEAALADVLRHATAAAALSCTAAGAQPPRRAEVEAFLTDLPAGA